jgi:hypothetical protein
MIPMPRPIVKSSTTSMTRIGLYPSAWNRIHPQRSHPSVGAHLTHAVRRVASSIVVVLQGDVSDGMRDRVHSSETGVRNRVLGAIEDRDRHLVQRCADTMVVQPSLAPWSVCGHMHPDRCIAGFFNEACSASLVANRCATD